ncbi:trimeric intracellular cation channel family protein [Halomonas sp. HP20-15]|uniref:trimeric intracellular cation channel family protein n=1 Tax=Halomonas sp. HP20-15 TaxID=3085901 RepID=UPI0029822F87|nr:trimeric intracellular cation channel family protein [Halomonas sp. HP20-15]MDW5378504.1 trimeric intracellular cation channel family protein [Halomonas sp. HP20-15]
MGNWVYGLDLAGVAVFALSGVMLACRSRMDPFGMLVLAAVTGIGGGTLRDLLLGVRPVFWVTEPSYLWIIVATVLVSIVGLRHVHHLPRHILPILDAFGLALFTAIGAHKALTLGHTGIVAVLMGLLTGVAGGILRDMLARRVPLVLRREIYATASIVGASSYIGLAYLPIAPEVAITLGVGITLALRLGAIRWQLSLPVFVWVPRTPSASREQASDDTQPAGEGKPAPPRHKMRVRMIVPERRRTRR